MKVAEKGPKSMGVQVVFRDKRRVAIGMKPLAEGLMDAFSRFVRMQPEHVDIAGALGLGIAEREKIDLREPKLD